MITCRPAEPERPLGDPLEPHDVHLVARGEDVAPYAVGSSRLGAASSGSAPREDAASAVAPTSHLGRRRPSAAFHDPHSPMTRPGSSGAVNRLARAHTSAYVSSRKHRLRTLGLLWPGRPLNTTAAVVRSTLPRLAGGKVWRIGGTLRVPQCRCLQRPGVQRPLLGLPRIAPWGCRQGRFLIPSVQG